MVVAEDMTPDQRTKRLTKLTAGPGSEQVRDGNGK